MQLGIARHLLVLAALVVNLWVGGDLVEAWLGRAPRFVAELVLILGYLWFVAGIRGGIVQRDRGGRSSDGGGAP